MVISGDFYWDLMVILGLNGDFWGFNSEIIIGICHGM
jgi:hypothetical protein